MSESVIREIQKILSEVDQLLRERMREARIDVGHVVVAVAPDGTSVVRSNVGPAQLGDMAEILAEVASGTAFERPEEEPLH